MDQLLAGQVQENKRGMEIKDKTLDLVDIYYESLDAPKTGIKVIFNPDLICFRRPLVFLLSMCCY